MNLTKLILSFLVLLLSATLTFAQDAITWSTFRNGSKVADTVSLSDYLPLKDDVVYVEAVIELPNTTKQSLDWHSTLIVNLIGSNHFGVYDSNVGIYV